MMIFVVQIETQINEILSMFFQYIENVFDVDANIE